MNHLRHASLLLVSASLLAQAETKQPRPFPQQPFTKTAANEPAAAPARIDHHLAAAPRAPRQAAAVDATAAPAGAVPQRLGVAFDAAAGVVHAASDTWKASFDGAGATFVPFLGSEAPRNFPVRMQLRSVGGRPAAVGDVVLDGQQVRIERPGISERYLASDAGIEQRFVFGELAQRTALHVTIDVQSEFAVTPHDGGFRFANQLGSFTYGRAIAFDAAGRSTTVQSEWTGSSIVLTVPASFVAAAQLPLTIDPLVGNATTIAVSTTTVRSTDIAYDATLNQYVVCWERVFSATDSDVYLRRLDGNLQIASSALPVDVTTTSWSKCKVAGLNAYDKFLVTAQAEAFGVTPYIVGRMFDAASAAPSFVIYQGALAGWSPDVGGDPSLVTPTYFTVVFERDFAAGDHDILFAQVKPDSTLRAPVAALDASGALEHSPHISKCDGQGAASTQSWAVVWRRDNAAGSAGMTRAAFLSWDGQLQLLGGQTSMSLSNYAAPGGPGGLDVSSPTDASRAFLVADTIVDAQIRTYFRGTVVDRLGTLVATGQQLSFPDDPDYDPALDCDGARFAMTWREANFVDQVVHATFDLVGNQVERPDADYVPYAANGQRAGGITSAHSGGAALNQERQYGLVWTENGSNTVLAQGYLGMGNGGFRTRNTGCGALTVGTAGVPAIGETVAVTLGNTVGIAGWAFGEQIDVPLGACPGCRVGTTAYALVVGNTFPITIPWNPLLVNLTFALQGFDLAGGSCLPTIALSDTVDMRVQ